MRILATVVLAAIIAPLPMFAQSDLPRALIGISVARASNDASSRMRLGQDTSPWVVAGEVSARIAPRVAIGAELTDLGTATGETRGITFDSKGEQRERAIAGLLRVRTAASDRVALDLIGGAGALFQRHTAIEASCLGCPTALTAKDADRASVLVAGADVPVRLGDHFSMAGVARYYVMRRGDNTPEDPRTPIRWQFEHESSGRLSVGGSARVTW